MTASGRAKDVQKLVEKIARPDCKMIVIHGYSSVGKSSLVQAGLVPALKYSSIGLQEIVPVKVRTYTNWVYEKENSAKTNLIGFIKKYYLQH